MRRSLAGDTIIPHPDELHDGQAETEDGFRYRMVYIQPSLIQDVLGGAALPFIATGVTSDVRLRAATEALLASMRLPPRRALRIRVT
jgi:hypothetical protein